MIPERIQFRPGSLRDAIGKRIAKTGETVSAYVRRLIAEDLNRKPPKMDGHVKAIKKVNRTKKKKVKKS